MDSISQFLQQMAQKDAKLPPVENWNPDYCGEMDLLIKANGDWIHQGSIIKRASLRRLFSTILKREDDHYYLVTPVEKVLIQVEWQPFVITQYETIEHQGHSTYLFTDNCDNQILLSKAEQMIESPYQGQSLPCIQVRRNLYAAFNRSCYYQLIEEATIIEKDQRLIPSIYSAGQSFALGEVSSDD